MVTPPCNGIYRLKQHLAAPDNGVTVARRSTGEFHLLLAELAGSPLLARYVSEVVSRSSLILIAHVRQHSSSCAVREHGALIEMIRHGDAVAAQASMREHLHQVAAGAALADADLPS